MQNLTKIRRITTVLTAAMMLWTSVSLADIDWGSNKPVVIQYTNLKLVPVNIQKLDDETLRIHTDGLTGELTIQGSNFPPEYEVPVSAIGKCSFTQELELIINLSLAVVEGTSSEQMLCNNEIIRVQADVRGNASCLPLNGRECGQLVVNLELQGFLSDPNDPAIVGQLHEQMLGSLVVDSVDFGVWAAMSANATIGGNEGLINSLTFLGDANLDGE